MPDTSGSQSAFLEGVPIRTSASAYLEASVPRITQYALEVLAQPDNAEPRITQYALEVLIRPFNSIPAFLAGTDTSTDSQAAYLKGSSPSTDNIPAFLSGISTLQTDSQSAYIYGQATATDATPAFAEGFQDRRLSWGLLDCGYYGFRDSQNRSPYYWGYRCSNV